MSWPLTIALGTAGYIALKSYARKVFVAELRPMADYDPYVVGLLGDAVPARAAAASRPSQFHVSGKADIAIARGGMDARPDNGRGAAERRAERPTHTDDIARHRGKRPTA